MSTRGFEAGLSIVPISTRDVEWTLRTTYQHNVQYIDKLSVPAFAAPGSFGVSYGRNRIAVGTRPTSSGATFRSAASTRRMRSGKLVVGTGIGRQAMPPHLSGRRGGCRKHGVAIRSSPTRIRARQTSFLNTFRFKAVTLTALVDWRVARLHVGHDEESVRRGRQLARLRRRVARREASARRVPLRHVQRRQHLAVHRPRHAT